MSGSIGQTTTPPDLHSSYENAGTKALDKFRAALRTGHSVAPTVDEITEETRLNKDTVESVTRSLSVSADEIREYWFMVPVSPLKRHPLVPINGHVALPSPGLFLPALQTLFEDSLKETPRWEDYQSHRAAYAEDRAARLFARGLPGAEVFTNLKYKWARGEGEVDVLVRFERHLFLIEVKSGDFADAARAGVESRVEGTLQDLVLRAHEQVARAAEYVDAVSRAKFKDGATTVEINRADLDEVHLVSLTLEQLGHIVNTAKSSIYAGKQKAPVSLSMDDLEVVVDVLTLPQMLLHYLSRREAYLPFLNVHNGDELGFLEEYLRTLLRDDPARYAEFTNVLLDPSSKTIDAFEHARGAGFSPSPPLPHLPPEILSLLEKLSMSRAHGWLQASLVLLGLLPRQQRRLARDLRAFMEGRRSTSTATFKGSDGATHGLFRLDDPRESDAHSGTVAILDQALNLISLRTH